MDELGTIGEAIRRHAEQRPQSPAIVSRRFLPLTYGELCQHIDAVRVDLREAGFDQGARIVVALQDGPHAVLALAAVSCSAVAVPLDLKLALPEVDRRLDLLRPAAIVLLRDSPSAARTAAEQRGLAIIEALVGERGNLDLRLVIPRVGPAAPTGQRAWDSPAFILQTSGTTSEPKLIPYSHRNMLAAAARAQAWFGLAPEDRCLVVSPIHYSHGLKVTVLTPLITGGSIAFPASTSRPDILEWFGALQPTWYSAAPTLQRFVLDKTKSMPGARSVHRLRFILSGGTSHQRDVYEGLQQVLGVPVVEIYGASEAGQISANLPPPGASKVGTCGIPPKDTVMVVGEDGRQAAQGAKGEVWVRGPTVISGYLDAPELNRAAFVDDWFRTGDIGSLDEDGFLTLHGRVRELINRGGEKIVPTEIDDALMRHPAVAEAAAYAVPHPRLGEDVAAAVVLRPGSTATQAELREFLSSQLAWFKIPRRIVFEGQLPKGLTGKVQRQRLGKSSV